ncbi:D-alanine--D-alanine ligase family protein, partial [Nocardiopsis halotolerans]|uniref:D-alanine--D-alanine ligase family protein n=1 Tax=Nocardiopsis halotolerans TaxID=124252 RepID=UPI00037A83DD
MPEARTRVAVVFGGRNGEYDVSCASAVSILAHLDRSRYEVVPVRITRAGAWAVGTDTDDPAGLDVERLLALTPEPGEEEGRAPRTGDGLGPAVTVLSDVDVAFPALHGPYGEDGTVQGMLELLGVPYVGNGVLASAAGMDKTATKTLLRAAGLPVARDVVLRGSDGGVPVEACAELGLPAFVKPARAGSSLGVARVGDWSELEAAVKTAREFDTKVLVEEGVVGREVDMAVLEMPDGGLVVGPPLEIRVPDAERFFDYDAKYDGESAVFDIPADLPVGIQSRLR